MNIFNILLLSAVAGIVIGAPLAVSVAVSTAVMKANDRKIEVLRPPLADEPSGEAGSALASTKNAGGAARRGLFANRGRVS